MRWHSPVGATRLFVAFVALLALSAGCTNSPAPSPSPSPSSPPTQPAGPSSFDLISAALADGKLSAEQALLYEAYATFADAQLPAQFRGDPDSPDEGNFHGNVTAAWPTLSPAAKAGIRPWTLPPYSEGSAWSQTPGGATAPTTDPDAKPFCDDTDIPISAQWNSQQAPGGIKVWWPKGDKNSENYKDTEALAKAIAASGADARSRTSKVLDGLTVPQDDGSSCAGGDTNFDIALWYDLGGRFSAKTTPHHSACPTSSYMIMDSKSANWGGTYLVDGDLSLKALLAHEFSHAVLSGKRKDCGSPERWFAEGTAVWVEKMAYYPNANIPGASTQVYVSHLDQPLNMPVPLGGYRAYGIWLFFYDVTQRHHDDKLIASMYRNTAQYEPLQAVMLALAPSGSASDRKGIDHDWRQFILDAWNKDEHNEWSQPAWGPIRARAKTSAPDSSGAPTGPPPTTIDLGDAHHRVYALTDTGTQSLANLSARYYEFDLGASKNVHWIRLRNPYATGSSSGDVRALILRNGQWKTEDWTGRPTVDLCQDHKDERAEQLVLIFGNHDPVAATKGAPELVARDACDRDFTITGTHRWIHNAPRDAVPWDTDGDVSFTGDMHCGLPDRPPWANEWTCTGSATVKGGGTIYAYRIGTSTTPPDCTETWVVLGLVMRFDGHAPVGPLDKVGLTRNPAGIPRDFKCRGQANATPGLAIDKIYLGMDLPLPEIGARLERSFPALDPAFGTPNGQITVTITDKN